MANKYFSKVRTLIFKNFFSGTMTVGSDFVVAMDGDNDRFIWLNQNEINEQTNGILKRLMITSNFADGLVWKTPCQAFILVLAARAFANNTALAGTVTFHGGTNNMTGVLTSFTTEAPVGTRIYDGSNNIYEVATVANDTTATVRECIPLQTISPTAGQAYNLSLVGETQLRPINVQSLQTWYEADEFFRPSIFSGATADHWTLELLPRNPETVPGIEFMTDSINTAFDQATVFFDLLVDMEYTPEA